MIDLLGCWFVPSATCVGHVEQLEAGREFPEDAFLTKKGYLRHYFHYE
jgi:hypothetical protein